MRKESTNSCTKVFKNEDGRVAVCPPDAFATRVSCDVLKFLSMKGLRTHFIEQRNATSFRALHSRPLGFSVAVKPSTEEEDIHTVDFFLNDRMRPLICIEEASWRLFHKGKEVGKIEPLISSREEMMVRSMTDHAFRALGRAFKERAKAHLSELRLEFGRPTSGYWAGKLVIAGFFTAKKCQVVQSERSDFRLSKLTEKLFM